MDLRLRGIPPSATERAAVDAVLGPSEPPWDGDGYHALQAAHGGEALRAQRHLLLPVLHAVQDRCGWISPEALDYLCQRLAIPPAEAYGVASFYALPPSHPNRPWWPMYVTIWPV
jgi:NADH-quinone oxidoreductase subunit F